MKLRIIKNRAGTYRVQQLVPPCGWVNLNRWEGSGGVDEVYETKDWNKAVDRMTHEGTAERRERDRKAWSTVQEFEFDVDGFEIERNRT